MAAPPAAAPTAAPAAAPAAAPVAAPATAPPTAPPAAAAKQKQSVSDFKDKDKEKEKKNQLAIANRPDEPDFKMEMSMDAVTFVCCNDKKPVYYDLTIKNTVPERQSFKIKCTSGDIFRVQPPLGFIQPGETQNIRLWFQNKQLPADKEKDAHYFAFYHLKSPPDEAQTIKQIWTKAAKPEGVRRLRVIFQEKK